MTLSTFAAATITVAVCATLVASANHGAYAAGPAGAGVAGGATPGPITTGVSGQNISVKFVQPGIQRQAPMQTRILSTDASPIAALAPDVRIEAVNAARRAASMAPLPPDLAAALGGGVFLSPSAPVSGTTTLGFSGRGFVMVDRNVLSMPLPSTDTPWEEAHVWVHADLTPNRLYVLDCDVTATNKHVPTVWFSYLNDVFTQTEPDPKTHHAFFAFRARDTQALLNLTAQRKPAEPSQPFDALLFRSCTLMPAQ